MPEKTNHRILSEIINQSPDGIWSIDANFCLSSFNHSAEKLLAGLGFSNIKVGESLSELRKKPEFENFFADVDSAFRGNTLTSQDSYFLGESELVFENRFSPILEAEKIVGVSIISREISEQSYFTRLGKSKFRELQIINSLSSVFNLANSLDELVEDCIKIVGEAMAPNVCEFIILDKDSNIIVSKSSVPKKAEAEKNNSVNLNHGIIGWVVQNKKSKYVPDTTKDPDYVVCYSEVLSELCVPIIVENEIFGVINLESMNINGFSSEDDQLIRTVANQIASTYERIHLFEITERTSREMSVLYKTALATGSELDSNRLLKRLYEQALEFFKPDTFLLALYDHRTHEMELLMADSTGNKLPELTNKELTLKETGLIEWVMKTRKILVTQELNLAKLPPVERWGDDSVNTSWLGTWLTGRDHLLGVISMKSGKPNAYSENDKRLLDSISGQVAIALENARLFEAENQRVKELAAISALSLAMREARDRRELLHILLDELSNLVKADGISLIIKDPVTGQQINEMALGKWSHNSGHNIPEELTIADTTWQSPVPVVMNSLIPNSDIANSPWMKQINAIVGLPLSLQGESIGMVWIGRDETFNEEEVRILTALGDIAASAIRRTTLNDQTSRQLQQLASLHDIDLAITGSTDLKVTLDFFLGSALTQLEMDGAIIQSLNPYSQTLSYMTGRGIFDTRILRGFNRMGDDLAGVCALERRLIQEPNLEKTSIHSQRARHFRDAGFNSYYASPLIAKGQVKGVLEVVSHSIVRVNNDWLSFFNMLSTQAAIAIDNGELFDNLQRSNMDLMVAYDSTLEGWANALELRDEETEGHARRVTEMTEKFALAVGVQGQDLNNVRRGALLHDIGKMGIPDQILLKPGPLTDEEWKIMRTHPELAYKLISPISFLRSAVDIPYCHHEKWNGTGYPRGLKGQDIPLSARMFAIIDVWDALSSNRPYRAAWPKDKVIDNLKSQAGIHFDPDLVKIFLDQILDK